MYYRNTIILYKCATKLCFPWKRNFGKIQKLPTWVVPLALLVGPIGFPIYIIVYRLKYILVLQFNVFFIFIPAKKKKIVQILANIFVFFFVLKVLNNIFSLFKVFSKELYGRKIKQTYFVSNKTK